MRLELFPENFWIIEKDLFTRYNKLKNDEITTQISSTLLVNVPHTIPFTLRAKVFQHLIAVQKDGVVGYHPVTICRNSIFEDAFQKIYKNKMNMKGNLQIKFVNEFGQAEEGIDGGGLFKEFVTQLCDRIFDSDYAYFKENESDRKLMPNHLSR